MAPEVRAIISVSKAVAANLVLTGAEAIAYSFIKDLQHRPST